MNISSIIDNLRYLFSNAPVEAEPKNVKRAAVCIGINDFPGSNNDLRGCVNDATEMGEYLKSYKNYMNIDFFFNEEAKKSAITGHLNLLAKHSAAGDKYVIHISSHGTYIIDTSGDEEDSKDEAIVLYDGLLTDDEFGSILDKFHPECYVCVIADTCHSGTITRLYFEGDVYNPTNYNMKGKFLRPTNLPNIDLNTIKTKKMFASRSRQMREVLITGCQSDEYSYDIRTKEGKYHGALTYYLLSVVKKYPRWSYDKVYRYIRSHYLPSKYPQSPQLEGIKNNRKRRVFE